MVWGGVGVGVYGLDIVEDVLVLFVLLYGVYVVVVNRNL